MDEILDGKDVVLAERLLDDRVVRKGNALLVDLAVAALVDQFANGLEVGLADFLFRWERVAKNAPTTYP